MAERDSDASGSSPARSGVSRRAFFRGAGVSAAGVALLDSGFVRAAEAVVRGGEQILTGKQVTERLAPRCRQGCGRRRHAALQERVQSPGPRSRRAAHDPDGSRRNKLRDLVALPTEPTTPMVCRRLRSKGTPEPPMRTRLPGSPASPRRPASGVRPPATRWDRTTVTFTPTYASLSARASSRRTARTDLIGDRRRILRRVGRHPPPDAGRRTRRRSTQ